MELPKFQVPRKGPALVNTEDPAINVAINATIRFADLLAQAHKLVMQGIITEDQYQHMLDRMEEVIERARTPARD